MQIKEIGIRKIKLGSRFRRQQTKLKEGYLMDIGLTESINSFVPIADKTILLKIEALEAENRDLRFRILELEDIQIDHERAINENATALNKIWQSSKVKASKGEKTKKRIERLELMLKSGPKSFRQIERDLKISPQEMSRLISKLDKRRYQITIREGQRKEKVLRLKIFNV